MCIVENLIDVCAEGSVVYQTVWLGVLLKNLVQFAICELEVQGTKASSELYISTKN